MFEYLTYLSLINWKKIRSQLADRYIKTGEGQENLLKFLLFHEKLEKMMNEGEDINMSESDLKEFLTEARHYIQ